MAGTDKVDMPTVNPLSSAEEEQFEGWVAAYGTPKHLRKIVLGAAAGQPDGAISKELSVNRKTVMLWRNRFAERRMDGLWPIALGRGRKPVYSQEEVADIVHATVHSKPNGVTHRSSRILARKQEVSKSTVLNLWQAHDLMPHLQETLKLFRDPKCLETMTDVVGLNMNRTTRSCCASMRRARSRRSIAFRPAPAG